MEHKDNLDLQLNEQEHEEAMKGFMRIRFRAHSDYYEIARKHHDIYMTLINSVNSSKTTDTTSLTAGLEVPNELIESGFICICFSAMCFEAFIYDYACENLSASYVSTHIDKLTPMSKVVVVSKLVTGKDFPTDSQAYEYLTLLFKTRNKLVHFKSTTLIEHFYKADEILEQWAQMILDAPKCFTAIRLVVAEMQKNDANIKSFDDF